MLPSALTSLTSSMSSLHVLPCAGSWMRSGHPWRPCPEAVLPSHCTQDIAVDGWALTLLSPPNVGYASTCQTIGTSTGFFTSFTAFLALQVRALMGPSFWYQKGVGVTGGPGSRHWCQHSLALLTRPSTSPCCCLFSPAGPQLLQHLPAPPAAAARAGHGRPLGAGPGHTGRLPQVGSWVQCVCGACWRAYDGLSCPSGSAPLLCARCSLTDCMRMGPPAGAGAWCLAQ